MKEKDINNTYAEQPVTNVKFREKQRFFRLEITLFLGFLMLLASLRFMDAAWEAISGYNYAIYLGIFAGLALVLYSLEQISLSTRIGKKGIRYRFFPLQISEHRIAWKEIKEVKVLESESPKANEWSGWGIDFSRRKEQYDISGKTGLQVLLKNGQQLFIGTKKPTELRAAIERYWEAKRQPAVA